MQEPTTQTVSISSVSDTLTEILRQGAQQMLAAAVEAEVAQWIDQHSHLVDENGHRQVVRNGHLPERKITTGLGEVEVRQPRVHDRRKDESRTPFTSKILPPYLRKTKSIEELLPWLGLLRLPGGALGPPTYHQSDRIHLRDGASPTTTYQRQWVTQGVLGHGLQVNSGC